jgi:hypothetical protein
VPLLEKRRLRREGTLPPPTGFLNGVGDASRRFHAVTTSHVIDEGDERSHATLQFHRSLLSLFWIDIVAAVV